MKQFRRLFLFLFVNILISACTTLVVLVAWDQLRGPLPAGLLPKAFNAFRESTATAPVSAPGAPALQATPTEEYSIYQAQEGDTFASVAEAYHVSVEELLAVNAFSKEDSLAVGTILRIPGSRERSHPSPYPSPH